MKFTDHGGKVTVRAARSDSCVRVEVEDTGIGIAREHLQVIFEELRPALEGAAECALPHVLSYL